MRLGFVVTLVVVAGCSATSNVERDASVDATADRSELDVEAGPCGPISPSGFMPTPMHPPRPAHAQQCTTQQAQDYAACEGGAASKCDQFTMGQSSWLCAQCIESQTTDPTWGVVVFDHSVGTLNTEGCVDDALGQVPYEVSEKGNGSCGDELHASYGCQEAACSACLDNESFTTCAEAARAGSCQGYDQTVRAPAGLCHVLFGDAEPQGATSCFPNSSIGDSAAQRADWIARMALFMCGP